MVLMITDSYIGDPMDEDLAAEWMEEEEPEDYYEAPQTIMVALPPISNFRLRTP